MAAIDPEAQTRILYRSDSPHRICLFAVTGVDTGDTLDVAGQYSKLQTAIASSVTTNLNSIPTIAGSVVTFGATGLVNDTVLLLTVGGWV